MIPKHFDFPFSEIAIDSHWVQVTFLFDLVSPDLFQVFDYFKTFDFKVYDLFLLVPSDELFRNAFSTQTGQLMDIPYESIEQISNNVKLVICELMTIPYGSGDLKLTKAINHAMQQCLIKNQAVKK